MSPITDPQIHMGQARYHQQRHEWALAEKSYTQALQLNFGLAEAHFALAGIYHRSGRYPQAVRHYHTVLELTPRDAVQADVFCALAQVLYDAKQIDLAEEALKRALHLNEALPQAWFLYGHLHQQQQKWAAAERCFKQVLVHSQTPEEASSRVGVHLLLAHLALRNQQLPQAQEYLRALPPSLSWQEALLSPAGFQPRSALDQWRLHLQQIVATIPEAETPLRNPLESLYDPVLAIRLQPEAERRTLLTALTQVYRQLLPDLGEDTPAPDPAFRLLRIGVMLNNDGPLGHDWLPLLQRLGQDFELFILGGTGLPPQLAGQRDIFYQPLSGVLAQQLEQVRALELDALLYTSLATLPPLLLAQARLAPLQALLPGGLHTSGSPAMDIVFLPEAFQDSDPELFSESLVYLPGAPWGAASLPAPSHGPESFRFPENANLYLAPVRWSHCAPEMLTLFALIAERDSQAVFLVQPTHDPALDRQTLATIPPAVADKIRMLPPLTQPQFLSLLAALPVVLDTPGTGLQGLAALCVRAGTSMVTCPGTTPDSRISAYYLQQSGHPEWVAANLPEMADIAVQVAQNKAQSTTLRQSLPHAELDGITAFYPALRDWLRAHFSSDPHSVEVI
jgi:tetratricopeptide (TPR) repeat protein